ncbi:DegT/DnrJ/EryC1/StrS family aminotransferase [Bacillus sp. FJAT-42376]|uniref:DegT/DnrJ/EryC1/StrS family aminotransferase n=1 Tax=Bacillus sp. FJAT-42376 TaxID=2014076 RepID=UPI000F504872|nr:DegT/DnrJ/EryC1/StrS family aminotransferase [Bacillus sp. FJAT-42376]AZB43749.1 DegT/DnrJ/EryC1/StrS family aminotransferase [Bacillus sp. FJAT-42376]
MAIHTEPLAIHGGRKTKTAPFGTGNRFGLEEAKELLEALDQNTLFYHFGSKVKTFLRNFNHLYSLKHSVAASSGTAAIHIALGAAGVTEGDEVITSPITDQGTVIGILYQNAIPVFADLEPYSFNLDPASIEKSITSRTKAIIAVHLAGVPCRMDAIMKIAEQHGLVVIEDCAQSYLAEYNGRLTGTIGHFGCFSTNDFKHISTGDGGMVAVNDEDEEVYRRAHAFADKNYSRLEETVTRKIASLAPNYRMTELQGAVGIAQLKKLPAICGRRTELGDRLTGMIHDIKGVIPQEIPLNSVSTYWFYMFRLDLEAFTCSRKEFSDALAEEGIPNQPGYIPEVLYRQPLFSERSAYPGTHYPFSLGRPNYEAGSCPIAERILETAVKLPMSEFYTDLDVEEIAKAIRKVALFYQK